MKLTTRSEYALLALVYLARQPKDEFISILVKIVQTGDLLTQQSVLKTVENIFRKEGFDQLFDSWEEMLPWMESFEIKG